MTAYFDDMHDDIRAAAHVDQLDEFEQQLVRDCVIPTQLPGFPATHVSRVFETVLRYATTTLPVNAAGYVRPEDESESLYLAARRQQLNDLCWHLHSVYHEVAIAGGLSDGPTTYLQAVYSQAEEVMEKMAEASFDEPVTWTEATTTDMIRLIHALEQCDLRELDAWPDLVDGVAFWRRLPGCIETSKGFAVEAQEHPVVPIVSNEGVVHAPNGEALGVASSLRSVRELLGLRTHREIAEAELEAKTRR